MSKHNHSKNTAAGISPVPETAETQAEAQAEAAVSPEAAAQAEVSALKERLLRLQADFDNFRKRTTRERADLYQRANEDFMRELLPVLDHFEMGMQTAEQKGLDPAVRTGFKMVQDQMSAALAKFGLMAVEAVGQPFDPNVHEAVSQMPSADKPAHTVLHEIRRGYRLGGQLLRAAQVVISADPPAPDEGGDGETAESGE